MMTIENLTYRELKEIAVLFNSPVPEKTESAFLGKYVICRCYSAGVHAGILVSQDKDIVTLKDSRRLWRWKANSGIALSGVAQSGLSEGCKIDVINPQIQLIGVIEIILVSSIARDSIHDYK
jgi:hypothetical protein